MSSVHLTTGDSVIAIFFLFDLGSNIDLWKVQEKHNNFRQNIGNYLVSLKYSVHY